MSEKFNLKWNDYQSNWNRSLSELRNDSDLADVTLITDDKEKFYAHKIVLSSCGNMFKFILKENTHSSPLLYLSGVSSVNLGLILDYIYHGEVNLFQEQLQSFLECAQKLEVEGLLGCDTEEKDQNMLNQNNEDYQDKPVEERKMVKVDQSIITRRHSNNFTKFDVTSMTAEEIEKKTGELYEKKDGAWSCLECDYSTSINSSTIRNHVETHLEGLSYNCSFCSKEFRSSRSLHRHKKSNCH